MLIMPVRGTTEGRSNVKFIVGTGGELRERLEDFPEKFREAFSSSKILVIGVTNDDDVVGACGIAHVSNYALIFIHEQYRARGLGTRIEAKVCAEAHRRGLGFVARAVHLWNLPSLRLASKVGYREVVRFKDFGYVLMMIPLNVKGKLIYTLLHEVCSRLPRGFLHAIVLASMSAVGLVRDQLSAD